jgi:hypothetical protein
LAALASTAKRKKCAGQFTKIERKKQPTPKKHI